MNKKVILMILDGWGLGTNPKVSAIAAAKTPFVDSLFSKYPHSKLEASGLAVGLPVGQMGNSEVGHMNIGAGRVVYQDYTKIEHAIETGEFRKNPTLLQAIEIGKRGALHILGLLSPGGVHSHESQIHELVDMAAHAGVTHLYVHAFLDGRDTPPQSAQPSLVALQDKL